MTPRAAVLAIGAVLAGALAIVGGATSRAEAADLNFAGSAQLDEFWVPTQSGNASQGTGEYALDGLTLEAAFKLAADVSDHVSANVKVCFGCHGFELDMAYLDYRFADELNVRAGRFSPSFGSFNLRHDAGNHKLSDKPLPYDMGRMLRLRSWNEGVLPSPFPDTGLEVNGTHWFNDNVQGDYAVYAVTGFRSVAAHPLDIDFRLSHAFPQAYYADNNGRPTVGARVALTVKLSPFADATVGASGMYGTYDDANALPYAIWGVDLSLRVARTFVRLEYLGRRNQVDTSDPTQFSLPLEPGDGHFVKQGAYMEVEQPIVRDLDLLGRVDGLYWEGNPPATEIGGAERPTLSRRSWVTRYTLGASWAVERSLRIKLSAALWQFRDQDDDGHTHELGVHASVVGTY